MAEPNKKPERIAKPSEDIEPAINPLPTPMYSDHNQPSPATRAQEGSFEPYEGQFEEFRKQPEADQEGMRKDPAEVQKQEREKHGRKED
jgi:hypothetical protein